MSGACLAAQLWGQPLPPAPAPSPGEEGRHGRPRGCTDIWGTLPTAEGLPGLRDPSRVWASEQVPRVLSRMLTRHLPPPDLQEGPVPRTTLLGGPVQTERLSPGSPSQLTPRPCRQRPPPAPRPASHAPFGAQDPSRGRLRRREGQGGVLPAHTRLQSADTDLGPRTSRTERYQTCCLKPLRLWWLRPRQTQSHHGTGGDYPSFSPDYVLRPPVPTPGAASCASPCRVTSCQADTRRVRPVTGDGRSSGVHASGL